jgi:hypothetical protein
MISMIRLSLVLVLLIGFAAPPAEAKTWRLSCGGFHFVRTHFTPAEIYITSFGVRNVNPQSQVTIERLVLRDSFGTVLSDTGPAGLMPHPLNTDVPEGSPLRDITIVPAGESRFIRTLHFPWGLGPVPGPTGAGNLLHIDVELSTAGKVDLVAVGTSRSVLERLVNAVGGFFEAAERTRDSSSCIRVD